MNTQLQQAKDVLFGADGLRVSNFKMFPGSSRETSVEIVAQQIKDSIQEILDGEAEEVCY